MKGTKPRCQLCRLVRLMDETRRHPSDSNCGAVQQKLALIYTCHEFKLWCPEHQRDYKSVSTMVEHWLRRVEWSKRHPLADVNRQLHCGAQGN